MKRAGLLINPNSGKSSGKGLGLAEMLKSNTQISIRILEKFEQLPGFLDEFANAGVTDLFISSGDGTIQVYNDADPAGLGRAIPQSSAPGSATSASG